MRYVRSCVVCGVAIAISLLFVGMAQADAITTLYQWQMGDDDGVGIGNPAPAITKADVGGFDLARTGSGTVVGSTSAGLGLGLTGNTGGSGAATSYYTNTMVDVNPADVTRWGFDAVVKFNSAPGSVEMVVMDVGSNSWGNSSVAIQVWNNHWILHRPGYIPPQDVPGLRETDIVPDTAERHIVVAGGEMWFDGVPATYVPGKNAGMAVCFQFNPQAGIQIGAGATTRGMDGAVSFARVFEYTGTFNIGDLPPPVVPEPSTLVLLATGLLGLLCYAWRKRKCAPR